MGTLWKSLLALPRLVAGGMWGQRGLALTWSCRGTHATAARVRIKTRMYTAAANMNIQPTRARPRLAQQADGFQPAKDLFHSLAS
jgi:hypothetical protein